MNIESLYNTYLEHPIVTTDSRNCPDGSMFFALKGANFDGNAYAASALESGCAVVVIDEEEYLVEEDERYVLVDDVLESLQQLAAYHRSQLEIPVIQITGTNGKTTTKELVSAVLAKKYRVRYTKGNLNNHIGVPLTLLSITADDEIAVVETGANHPGEIEFLCKMVQADCGLITNVGRAHLEGFGSFEGVKKTKGELYDDLLMRDKFIFLNMLDEDLLDMAMERGIRSVPYVQGVALGCSPFLQVAWLPVPSGKGVSSVSVRSEMATHLIGNYNLNNVLAAATVGQHFGVSVADIKAAVEEYQPTNSRSEFRDTGRNHLIVDAYNANPTSMAAALDNFLQMEAENKMVILGDMRELGEDSQSEHEKIRLKLGAGRGQVPTNFPPTSLQEAWLVGENFMSLPKESETGEIKLLYFHDVQEVKDHLAQNPLEGKTILIKGSNGTKLYQLPELL